MKQLPYPGPRSPPRHAPVALHDPLHQSEPDTQPALPLTALSLMSEREEVGERLLTHAHASVFDGDARMSLIVRLGGHVNGATGRRHLQGVVNQVHHHLLQPVEIAIHPQACLSIAGESDARLLASAS